MSKKAKTTDAQLLEINQAAKPVRAKKATPRKTRSKQAAGEPPKSQEPAVVVEEPKAVEPIVAVPPLKGDPAPKKQTGLRKPQIKVLQALAKSDKPISRKELAEQAGVDQAMCTEYLGSNDEAIRLKNDAKVMPSLLTLGHIQSATEGGKASYSITDSGRKAIEEIA